MTSRWFRQHPDSVTAGTVLVVVVVSVLLAPWISPYDPAGQSAGVLAAPSTAHWLGTDALGRDTLSRLLHGGGPILGASLGAVLMAVTVGTVVGVLAGVRGGFVEVALMRVIDVLLAFPSILLAILMVAALGRGLYVLA